MDWDWEDLWLGLLAAVAVGVLLSVGVIAFAPHNVDYYYVSRGTSGDTGTCVWAHWTWHTDEKAWCTNDPAQALDFAAKATAALRGK
ncbi:MAG TPA: hypothetical protein VFW94_23680 [Candidatus Acidoferrales bacterium]|nr:hypothetical protein [Candidatus Acidoferrales bacterium]